MTTTTEDDDYAYALSLQNEFLLLDNVTTSPSLNQFHPTSSSNETSSKRGKCKSLVDPEWELIDPNPDVHTLFIEYNKQFFWGRLDMVSVRWSPRMTLCAGICCYEGGGGLCSIRLSKPLLSLRPRKDLVETLLHEMIHAYLFVTNNNRDRDGHGPEFCKHMNRINQEASTNISIYHSFHDEVDEMRKHWWRCEGVCRTQRPFYGYVKRSMNRAPSKNDTWWSRHQQSCGGTFVKIKEPEDYGKKKVKNKGEKSVLKSSQKINSNHTGPPKGTKTIDSFMKNLSVNKGPSTSKNIAKSPVKENKMLGNMGGIKLEVNSDRNPRGIPLNSRLLAKFSSHKNDPLLTNDSSIKSRCKDLFQKSRQGNGGRSLESQLTPLQKVCQAAERTGVRSVSAGAFNKLNAEERFFTPVIFSSDDEEYSDVKKKTRENLKNNSNIFKNDTIDKKNKSLESQDRYKNLTSNPPILKTDIKPATTLNGISNHFSSKEGFTKSIPSKRKSDPDALCNLEVGSKKKRPNFDSKIFVIDSSSDDEEVMDPDSLSVFKTTSTKDQHPDSSSDDELFVCTFLNQTKKNPALNEKSSKDSKISMKTGSGASFNLGQEVKPSSSFVAKSTPQPSLPSSSLEFNCPICSKSVPAISINNHVDNCLTMQALGNNAL